VERGRGHSVRSQRRRPLPFVGLSYLDFDVLGTGGQMTALLAGPFGSSR
jgi:hypothetical protein